MDVDKINENFVLWNCILVLWDVNDERFCVMWFVFGIMKCEWGFLKFFYCGFVLVIVVI